jgi:predicted RNA polymerase sigma factor
MPVVALNRAVAFGMAQGPDAGLAAIDALEPESRLAWYHLVHAARGELLSRAGRTAEARAAFARAAALSRNARERALLERRACAT